MNHPTSYRPTPPIAHFPATAAAEFATPSSGQSYAPQAYSSQAFPSGGHSAYGNPTHGYSAQGYSAQGYSAQGYSAQGNSAQGYSPQSWPQQSYPQQSHPQQSYPQQSYPSPQSYTPHQAYPPQQQASPRPAAPAPARPKPSYTPQSYPLQPYGQQPGAAFPGRPAMHYPVAPPTPPARPRRGGRIVLVLLLLVLALGGIGYAALAATPPAPVRAPDSGAIAQPGTLSVFQLQPGDCYNSAQAPPPPGQTQPISVVQAVQCTEPHSNQVVAKVSYASNEISAGVPATRADADCTAQFRAKLDPATFNDPTLKPGRLAPADAATWNSTPVVACVVFSDNPINRSLLR